MKPELDPTLLAEGLLGTMLVAFEHAESCGLHVLSLHGEGKKLSRPNRLRIRCNTCGALATLPTPAHFLRAWNRKAEPLPDKIIDMEAVVLPSTPNSTPNQESQ